MFKIDSNYLRNTYLLGNILNNSEWVLKRFNTIEDIAVKLDEKFKDYEIRVKSYDFKEIYENDFQDYELMICLGNKEEDLIDLTIYYAISRIGEKIITEIGYEII